jgi:hypothetical protein
MVRLVMSWMRPLAGFEVTTYGSLEVPAEAMIDFNKC